MKRLSLILLALAVLAAAAAAGALAWQRSRTRSATYYTDGGAIRQPAATAPLRDILWEPAAALPAPVNTADDDYEPRLSADGQTLFFVRGRAGGSADIFTATRTPEGWSAPIPFAPANSEADDLGPCPSRDGSAVYFYSDRDGGLGGYDLWVVRRLDSGWREPANLGAAVNSPFNDYGPALAPDGATLYFASNRPRPGDEGAPPQDNWPATLREDMARRTYDLFAAPITGSELGPAAALAALNTDRNEGAPAVAPNGDFLYFASDRPGGRGGFDLYRSRRLAGDHLAPESLGEPLNTSANELDPDLGMAGFEIHFSSDRLSGVPPPASDGAAQTRPTYDIHHSISREVFPQVDRAEAATDWAALWEQVWPWLGWLALLLLLLLLALLALRNPTWRERYGKMGLLARSVLLSLLLHALLMSALAAWRVGNAVGDFLRSSSGTRVILSSSVGGDTLIEQVRGGFSDVQIEAHESEAAPADVPHEPESRLAELTPAPTAPPDQPLHTAAAEAAPAPDAPPLSPVGPATLAAAPEVAVEPGPTPAPTSESALHISEARAQPSPVPAAPAAPESRPVEAPPLQVAREATQQPLARNTALAAATPEDLPAPAAALPPTTAAPSVATPRATSPAAPAAESRVELSAAPSSAALPSAAPPPAAESLARLDPTRASDLAAPSVAAPPALSAAPVAAPSPGAAVLDDILPSRSAAAPTVSLPALEAAVARAEADSRNLAPAPSAAPARPDLARPSSAEVVRAAPSPLSEVAPSALASTDAAPASPEPPPTTSAPAPAPAPTALAGVALPTETAAPQRNAPTEPASRLAAAAPAPAATSDIAIPAPYATLRELSPSPAPHTPAPSIATATPDATPPPLAAAAPAPAPSSLFPALAALALPAEIEAQPGGESDQTRRDVVDAIDAALKWLAAHQAPDGRWSSRHFGEPCGCPDAATYDLDAAVTGLALQAFLGAGHTHLADGPYRDTIQRALRWLVEHQDQGGNLGPGETMYSQGMGATALAEAYARTRDPALAEPLARAVAFIDAARHAEGGWGASPGSPGDSTVLGWQVTALVGARRAGVSVPQRAFQAARDWVERVNVEPGLYAVAPGEAPATWATAECMLTRHLLGEPAGAPGMDESAAFIGATLPDWAANLDTFTWHFTTLALLGHPGEHWERWSSAVVEELTSHQRTDAHEAGSWDVAGDQTAGVGGRIYQTATAALILETVLRDPPDFAAGMEGRPGTLSGRVLDALTDEPIAGATVRLDLPDGDSIVVRTGPAGRFTLRPVDLPPHVAVSASAPGYTPESIDVAERDLVEGLRRDFRLSPADRGVIAMESDPQVHHLGDNEWSGRINSQFQMRSEGQVYEARFTLTPEQAPPRITLAEVLILAKGTQAQNEVRINGNLVSRRLTGAPRDGSFGEFRATFPAEWLVPGENTLLVRGVYGEVDYDDFEFVNVRVVITAAE